MSTVCEPEEIVIENVGPVEELHIPLPIGGGVVVLTGDNGSGKTESLNSCRALMGSASDKKSLRPKDGEKSGCVEGCGVTLKVGRSNRETGELTVAALEDRLDIADLVDPGIADPNSADARRLKSLIRVSGVKADLELFNDLLGDTVEIDGKVIKETDLIDMAAGVKRHLESKARAEETKADASQTEAATCMKSVEGIDVTGESDETTLQAAYRAAANRDAELRQQATAATNAQLNQDQARKALDHARDQYQGPTVAEAEESLTATINLETAKERTVTLLTEELRQAREALACVQAKRRQCETIREAADRHQQTIAAWEQQLAADLPASPSHDECQAAADAMDRATRAMQNGAIVRNAKAKIEQSNEWNKKRKAHAKAAERFREAAKSVDDVLSQVVAELGCPIKVGSDDKGLRLTIEHPKRGTTFFGELSMGEKYAVVIPIAVKAVGPGGLFVIPQEAWEGLQPKVKSQIAGLVKGTHVTAITAQCADGPLEAKEVAA